MECPMKLALVEELNCFNVMLSLTQLYKYTANIKILVSCFTNKHFCSIGGRFHPSIPMFYQSVFSIFVHSENINQEKCIVPDLRSLLP